MARSDRTPQLRDAEWIVAQFSTHRNAIPLDEVTLLGLAGKPGEETAILRLATGEILSVKAGETTAVGDVVDVVDDSVLLFCEQHFVSLYLSATG